MARTKNMKDRHPNEDEEAYKKRKNRESKQRGRKRKRALAKKEPIPKGCECKNTKRKGVLTEAQIKALDYRLKEESRLRLLEEKRLAALAAANGGDNNNNNSAAAAATSAPSTRYGSDMTSDNNSTRQNTAGRDTRNIENTEGTIHLSTIDLQAMIDQAAEKAVAAYRNISSSSTTSNETVAAAALEASSTLTANAVATGPTSASSSDETSAALATIAAALSIGNNHNNNNNKSTTETVVGLTSGNRRSNTSSPTTTTTTATADVASALLQLASTAQNTVVDFGAATVESGMTLRPVMTGGASSDVIIQELKAMIASMARKLEQHTQASANETQQQMVQTLEQLAQTMEGLRKQINDLLAQQTATVMGV